MKVVLDRKVIYCGCNEDIVDINCEGVRRYKVVFIVGGIFIGMF